MLKNRYLTRYPLTGIKIDRCFVAKIIDQSEGADTAIVRGVISMAHSLGLEVTAEGVETECQAEYFCEEAQGYLYGKPMPLKDWTTRGAARNRAPQTCMFWYKVRRSNRSCSANRAAPRAPRRISNFASWPITSNGKARFSAACGG